MRLHNFLNEKDPTIDDIFENCKPYLNLIGVKSPSDFTDSMTIFYRGDNRFVGNTIQEFTMRKRYPIGTSPSLFPIINEWLKKNGHVTRDNCALATSDKYHANDFGRLGIFLPIGNFKFSYVLADDFNNQNYDISGWDSFALLWQLKDKVADVSPRTFFLYDYEGDDYYGKDALEIIKDFSPKEKSTVKITVLSVNPGGEDIDTYNNWEKRAKVVNKNIISNKNITEAAKGKYEIWFECKKYYLVDKYFLF